MRLSKTAGCVEGDHCFPSPVALSPLPSPAFDLGQRPDTNQQPNLLLDFPTATSKLSSTCDLLFGSLRSGACARLSLCRPVLCELSVFSLKEKLPGFLGAAQPPAAQVFSYLLSQPCVKESSISQLIHKKSHLEVFPLWFLKSDSHYCEPALRLLCTDTWGIYYVWSGTNIPVPMKTAVTTVFDKLAFSIDL